MNRPEDLATSRLEKTAPIRSASDELISIADIRGLFKLGRTAAYELTHRPGFPDHVEISPRCYRWWASEVYGFAATLRRERAQGSTRRATKSLFGNWCCDRQRLPRWIGRLRCAVREQIWLARPSANGAYGSCGDLFQRSAVCSSA